MEGNWAAPGVEAFTRVLGALDAADTNKQRRELMAQEAADRKIERERRDEEYRLNKPLVDLQRKESLANLSRLGKMGTMEDNAMAAYEAIQGAKDGALASIPKKKADLAIGTIASSPQYFKAKTIEEIHAAISDTKNAIKEFDNAAPVLQALFQQGGKLTRDQAPSFFDAIEKLAALDPNVGPAADGLPAEKHYSSLLYDPKTGKLAAEVQVKDSKGKIYFAPKTFGNDANPDAPVVMYDPATIKAMVDSQRDAVTTMEEFERLHGTTNFGQMVIKSRKAGLESRLTAKTLGDTADWVAANPDATRVEMRAVIGRIAARNAEELGVPLTIDFVNHLWNGFKNETTPRGNILYHPDGRAMGYDTAKERDELLAMGFTDKVPRKEESRHPDVKRFEEVTGTRQGDPGYEKKFREFTRGLTADRTKEPAPERPLSATEKRLRTTAAAKAFKEKINEVYGGVIPDELKDRVQKEKDKFLSRVQEGELPETLIDDVELPEPPKEKGAWEKAKEFFCFGGKRELKRPDEGKKAPVVPMIKAGAKAKYRDGTTAKGTGSDAGKEYKVVNGVWVEQKKR